MAKKICGRTHKETEKQNRKQEVLPDELTLRDEILELKRQVMILRRTNEQYSVRLRKYEEEAKRKDKQLEQLMNPRKNAEVTKMLSTKGAAILMTLKDQNNALIQMLLNKDLHIRRLVAEVKMSKLYASTKRNEFYKAEISRLRNLLIKSEETLKENVEIQQEQTRSICVSENPILEFSSSSDQSSPRDLDELRGTILRLETHIKCSNDLLAQKNHEISLLSDELNLLRKYLGFKTSKAEVLDCDFSTSHKFSAKTFTCSWPETLNPKKVSSQDLLDFFEKHPTNQNGHLSHSAPAGFASFAPSNDSTPEHRLPITTSVDTTENHKEASAGTRTDCEDNASSTITKSLFHNLATNEIIKEEKLVSRSKKPLHTKDKWKRALTKYKEFEKHKSELVTGSNQKRKQLTKSQISSGILDFEAHELEPMEKDLQGEREMLSVDAENSVKAVDKLKPADLPEKADNSASFAKNYESIKDINEFYENDLFPGSCQTLQNYPSGSNGVKCLTEESAPGDEAQSTHKDTVNLRFKGSPQTQINLKTSSQNNSEETKTTEINSLREVYYHSVDSSFDSENSYTGKQEVQQVQVEVQINSVSFQNDTEQSEKSISESGQTNELDEEIGGTRTHEFEFNDDDDVIVR